MNATGLETFLVQRLGGGWPMLYGHVREVHANQWLAVYFSVRPDAVSDEEFAQAVAAIDRVVVATPFRNLQCKTKHCSGRDINRCHFYCFWLPIAPQRRKEDFASFFPVKRSL